MKKALLSVAALALCVSSADGGFAAWPGGNGPIAFTRDGAVYMVEPDGSGEERVADGVNPSWSPDGTILVYTCDGQICTVVPGEEPTQVTLDPTFRSRQASWSPDGQRIVFSRKELASTDDDPRQLYTMTADGSGEQGLGVDGNDPAWSPDGETIIFTQGRQGNGIFSVSPSGEDFEELFANGRYVHSPSWSPDGKRIAFTLQYRNYWRVWLVDADGSTAHEIFRGKGRARKGDATMKEVSGRGLSWSPSGRRILYHSVLKDAICKIDLEGHRRGCLVAGHYPDWGPREE